jgi:diguanylate cyclase (GGDEF)-like protein/PAS domain S-box-containing protein
MARSLLLPSSSRPCRLLKVALLCAALLPAGPALAGLPEGMGSPWVTLATGLAMMLAVAGGIYLLLLRQQLARLQAQLSAPGSSVALVGEAAPECVGASEEGPDRYFRLAAEAGHGVEGWINLEGRLYWVNQLVELYTGYSAQEVLAADFIDLLVYERDRRYCRDQIRQALEGGVQAEFELRIVTKAGSSLWMACHWQPIRNESGMLLGLRVSMNDIQARKEAEYKLLESVAALRRAQALSEHYLRRSNEERSRLSALLDVVRMGILFMDADRRVVFCNRALYDIWRMPPGESFVGVRDAVLQQYVMPFLEEPVVYQRHIAAVLEHRAPSEPFEIHFKDGRVITDFSRVVPGPEGTRPIGRMWVFEDVTEQRRVAEQLMRLAERDPLTNLFNRRRFHEELERMLADGRRHHEEVGLLAIDLDGFKPVNDRFGHQAGDEVLVGLSNAVLAVVRRNEMFFRMGGDEFAILVPSASAQELSELARRVCVCIAGMHFTFGGDSVFVTASIGIAIGSHHDNDGERLIGAADRAMYVAKASGGNCWELARESRSERLV